MNAKLFLLHTFFFFSSLSLFSQAPQTDNWKLITTESNVSVYYEHGTCRDAAVLFIRVVNNNAQAVTVDWSMWDGKSSKSVQVKANETITGKCVNMLPMFTLTERIPADKSDKDMHAVIKVQLGK